MSTFQTATETKSMSAETKQARVKALLNEKEFSLRLAQLILKPDAEQPVKGKKAKIGYESLKELAKKGAVEIADLELSILHKEKGVQFCAADGEIIDEKTLVRYVKQIPENMTALGLGPGAQDDVDEITIVLYYLTTVDGSGDVLATMLSKEEVNAFTSKLHTKRETAAPVHIDVPQAKGRTPEALSNEINGTAVPGAAGIKPISPKQMNLKQWTSVFQSLQLLNGEYIHGKNQAIFKASKPAFRLQRKINPKDYLSGADSVDKNEEQMPVFTESHTTSITTEEITNDLQRSLASAGHTEASLSTAIAATIKMVQLSGQIGVNYDSSKDGATSVVQSAKEVKGYWNAPQVELSLTRNTMALDPDCKAALDGIIENTKYEDVVKFLEDYGTLFSQKVTLGGRLMTSQAMSTTTTAGSASSKQAIQASIAAGIAVPFVAKGSVEGSVGTGSSTSEKSSTAGSSTALAWQAQGGDTHLAQNPTAWLPTVKDYNTWFPIQKELVVSMEEMISGFSGYEQIPTLFAEILAQTITKESAVKVPWSPALSKEVKDSKRLVGLALDSYTGHLKESPFKPLNWDRMSHPKQATNPDPAFCWKLFKSNEEIRKEATSALQDAFGIEAQVNTGVIPAYLYSLQASDRSLTVMMKWVSSPRENSMASPLLKLTDDAAKSISKNSPAFLEKHGDRFVCGWSEQASVIVVWTIEGRARGDAFNKVSQQITSYFQTPRTLHEGCNYFSSNLGANCFADVFKSSSESNAVVLFKESAHPSQVFPIIEEVEDEDYIPTKVHLKSYRSLYPGYTISPPEVPTVLFKKIRDLLHRNIMLHVKSKTSPFRKDSAPVGAMASQVKELRNKIEQEWTRFMTNNQGIDIVKQLEIKHSEHEESLATQFFARDWLRCSRWAEDTDVSITNSDYTCWWTKCLGTLDPPNQSYDPTILGKVKSRLAYFEDSKSWDFNFWQSHDNKRYFEINKCRDYYLVAYQMRSCWGNDTNGKWWIESGDRHAVARKNPRVAHRKVDLRGYKWVLESWWLSKQEFPFNEDELA